MQARARVERGQLDGAMKDLLAAWTHEIRDTFCGGGRQRRKAIVDSLGTAIAGADAKVISRGGALPPLPRLPTTPDVSQ